MNETENRYQSIYEPSSPSARGGGNLGSLSTRHRSSLAHKYGKWDGYVAAIDLRAASNYQFLAKWNDAPLSNNEVEEAALVIPKFVVKDSAQSEAWAELRQNRASKPLIVESHVLDELIDLAHIVKQSSLKANIHNILPDNDTLIDQKSIMMLNSGLYVDARHLGMITALIFSVLVCANFVTDRLFIHPVIGAIGILFGSSYFVMSIVDQKG